MKSKKVLLIGGSVAMLLMVVLVGAVFFMQDALAQKNLAMDAPIPEIDVAELQEEVLTKESDTQEVSAAETLEIDEAEWQIGYHARSQKVLKDFEIVLPNWMDAEPGAADLSEEQAVETAKLAAQVFGLKDLDIKQAVFQKDTTGQRGNYWSVVFKEDDLEITIDALNGAVTRAYSEDRRSVKDREVLLDGEFEMVLDEIVKAEDAEKGGKYTAATLEIAQKYIPGSIKDCMPNAVHGDGKSYPLVSIVVEMADGSIYEFEWSATGENGAIELCNLRSFPSWDHFIANAGWDADLWMNTNILA